MNELERYSKEKKIVNNANHTIRTETRGHFASTAATNIDRCRIFRMKNSDTKTITKTKMKHQVHKIEKHTSRKQK